MTASPSSPLFGVPRTAEASLPLGLAGALWLASIGCDGRALALVIDARAYRDLEVRLHVLAAPDTVSCEGLAFGDTRIDTALGSEIDRVSFRTRIEETITGLDRDRRTLLLAEALDVAGTRVALGCAELDPSGEGITIALEPVAIADTPEGTGFDIDAQGKSPAIHIPVADASGRGLSSVPGRYTMVSGDGRSPAVSISSDAGGRFVLEPELPRETGPLAIDLRVRWRLEGPILLTSFRRPPAEVSCLPPEAPAFVFGRFGGGGLLGMARLTAVPTGPRTRSLALEFCRFGQATGADISCPGGAVTWSIEGDPMQLVVLEGVPPEDDRVLVITTAGWWEVGTDRARVSWPQGPASPMTRPSGPCPRGAEVLTLDGARYRAFRQNGEVPALPLRGTLLASGCVSTSDGGWIRAYVTQSPPEEGGGAGIVAHDVDRGLVSLTPWNGPPTGFGFSRPIGDDPALLLGTQFELSDVVTTRAIFGRKESTLPLTTLGFDVLPALPIAVVAGDLDGDRHTDVAALLIAPDPMTQMPRFLLWSALGERDGRPRISGTARIDDLPIASPALGFGDIDGDGDSDFVLAGNASLPSCPTPSHLITLRSE